MQRWSGGPLSPLLSNILLDDLDKELERRGLQFVRYADDFVIFVRSERGAKRVFASVQRYLTQRLKLVVNEQKSSVRLASGCEYLGFMFVGKRVTIKVAPKKLKAFKCNRPVVSLVAVWLTAPKSGSACNQTISPWLRRIKELTGRSRGISIQRRLTDLNRYVRGWIGYFGLARQFDDFADLDGCRVFFLATRVAECGCVTGNSGGIPARRSVT